MLEINYFFAHFMSCSILLFDFSLLLLVVFRSNLGLIYVNLHFLNKLLELLSFNFFLLEAFGQVAIVLLHLGDNCITLLEFFFDNFKLLRISKGIFRLDYFLKLASQTRALLHIKLNL